MAVSPGGRPMDTSPFSTSTTDNWVARAGGLPPYIRGVAHALLRTGRAKDLSGAVRLAVGAIQHWAAGETTNGKGHVHPQVQAAAAAALADWNAKRGVAHAHSNSPEDSVTVELAGAFNEALHPRVGAGAAGGGRFTSGGAAQPAKGQQGKPAQRVKGKPVKAPPAGPGRKPPPSAKAGQAHNLRTRATALRGRADVLDAQADALAKAHPTSAAASKAATSKAKAAAPKKNLPTKHRAATANKKAKTTSTVSVASRVKGLRAQAVALRGRARMLDERASKIKLANNLTGVELAVKTPAPERAAGRKALAAKGDALPGGTAPIPDVAYLKKAIRSKGRVDPAKWPALKALIRKRAKELGAENEPGVKGTWPWAAAKSMGADRKAVELAMMARVPRVSGAADVQCSRAGDGSITVMHRSTGMKVGTVHKVTGGWQGVHVTGQHAPMGATAPAALSALIGHHNKLAKSMSSSAAMPNAITAAAERASVDLSSPANTSGDGPRVTSMGGGKPAKAVKPAASPMGAEVAKVYRKLIARGMKPAQAKAMAKRAAMMHAKAQSATAA